MDLGFRLNWHEGPLCLPQSVVFVSVVIIIIVCMCVHVVCMCSYSCVHKYVCTCGGQRLTLGLPQSRSTLFLGIVNLTEPGAHQFD